MIQQIYIQLSHTLRDQTNANEPRQILLDQG